MVMRTLSTVRQYSVKPQMAQNRQNEILRQVVKRDADKRLKKEQLMDLDPEQFQKEMMQEAKRNNQAKVEANKFVRPGNRPRNRIISLTTMITKKGRSGTDAEEV